jgi:prepilin-type N-terminal cleavage/methylation domain-containing protein
MRIRREHPASGGAGFTLIEIMMVVVMIALIMGMGAPAIYHSLKKEGMRKAINDIEEACNKARASAILSGKPAELHFMPADRKVDAPGMSAQLPDSVNVEMFDVNFTEYKDADSATVRFFPNGRSDDMTVILSSAKNEWRRIDLDITTGIVDDEEFRR